MKPLRRIHVEPALPERLADLEVLAYNLHSTWDPTAQELFRSIDPACWEAVGGNPVRLLDKVGAGRLAELAGDDGFLHRLGTAKQSLERHLEAPGWYAGLDDAPAAIAYFSPEFGVSEILQQYSGGLGVLAGDHLKASSDLGVSIVGVGLFYRFGYFVQSLSADGMQQERYPLTDPQELPLELLTDDDGKAALVTVRLPGATLHAQIWQARVGRVTLLMLDSDVPENAPAERAVTDRLYGGGSEHRLRQEILLGIGGVRALDAYGVKPQVFHTNEGHAGFLGLERIRRLIEDERVDKAAAIEAVRAGTVFTTHTPVPAGIDRFPRELIERYFGPGGVPTGLELGDILGFGLEPDGDGSLFNMAVMGLRLAARANGVSALHGEVSRGMFANLWPGLDEGDVPITHITNGVHAGTWITPEARELFDRHLPADYAVTGEGWDTVHHVADEELWALRSALRRRLVEEVRRRLRAMWRARGVSDEQLGWVEHAFDPEVLTIGFARRVPSYKRLTLILREPERLRELLLHPERPIQLIVAGKSHPADEGGKRLIQQFAEFASEADVRHRIVFLPDYDMAMARILVAGADVWLNNPLRPLEACGTSGMKAALNGCLNLSIRDGWWDELYDGGNGWAIPSADVGVEDPDRRDAFEATSIYDLLEHEVSPLFYDRVDWLPRRWIAMVKHGIAGLGPFLLATRMVRDYVTRLYVPAAQTSRELSADGYAGARRLAEWKARVHAAWPAVAVRRVDLGDGPDRAGEQRPVEAVVELGALAPEDVEVQVAYGRVDDQEQLEDARFVSLKPADRTNGTVSFKGELPLDLAGSFGYTVRVVPSLEGQPALSQGLVAWAAS